MCVIIVKPAGAAMPSKQELMDARMCHPHGMGFVSPSASYKGMSFETFYKRLRQVPVDDPCIIHFRYATNGSVKRSNCHPFNIGNVWFAHNGVLSIKADGDMTDSETAFRDTLYPAIQKYGIKSMAFRNVVNAVIGYSRFAFMQDGQIYKFGHYTRYNGRYYSNTRHLSFIDIMRYA